MVSGTGRRFWRISAAPTRFQLMDSFNDEAATFFFFTVMLRILEGLVGGSFVSLLCPPCCLLFLLLFLFCCSLRVFLCSIVVVVDDECFLFCVLGARTNGRGRQAFVVLRETRLVDQAEEEEAR